MSASLAAESVMASITSRKLNVGCGYDRREGYLNVDLQGFHKPDLVGNILDLPMLPSCYFDEILSKAVIEHFPWRDTPRALFEWNRLLRPGGVMYLRTVYLNGLLRRFERPDYQPIALQKLLIVNLFSMQKYEGDYHLAGFTERLMRYYLWECGFEIKSIEIVDEWLFDIVAVKSVDHAYLSLVNGDLSDDEFVRQAYRAVLMRDADKSGSEAYVSHLKNNKLTRPALIKKLLLSDERENRMEASCPDFQMKFHEANIR
jgi:predicted SAM-dependent methyltransferase